ncbi:MAG: PaaI family thioesterase [Rhodospirillales bacterium]|nr:PaaI family thioesterase [Rhodospirillales bacterium]
MTEPAAITVEAFEALCRKEPGFYDFFGLVTEEIGRGSARVRLPQKQELLRPGGTVSGPAQMGLADCAIYAALLGAIGPVPLAVTTNFSINFLSKPQAGDLICSCRLLKLGKRLAVAEARVFGSDAAKVYSHVTATYAIPPSAIPPGAVDGTIISQIG